MGETFVITAKAENVLRILPKLSSLMTRKRLKIQEMRVNESSLPGESYLFLILQLDPSSSQWLMKQLGKVEDLFDLELKLRDEKALPPNQRLKDQEGERSIITYTEVNSKVRNRFLSLLRYKWILFGLTIKERRKWIKKI